MSVEQKKTNSKASIPTEKKYSKMAIVRVRGTVRATPEIRDTLFMFRLRRKNTCVVIENEPSRIGMAIVVKDYATYGEIDDETYNELVTKRGKKDTEGKLKPWFELAPPRGGFERKGIKKGFSQGGTLGYRGTKIKDLIKKMI